jgi:hypothetical protein
VPAAERRDDRRDVSAYLKPFDRAADACDSSRGHGYLGCSELADTVEKVRNAIDPLQTFLLRDLPTY